MIEAQAEKQQEQISQSHHTGIEMAERLVALKSAIALNRTIQELK